MSDQIRGLEPSIVWNHFADLNAVPRASRKEEQAIEFMRSFGEGLGLKTMVDEIGNVIIKKPASAGMEDRTSIVMQGHIDMVHQKNSDTNFDFDTEGIKMFIEGDWVKAEGTTLGADNGLGVASIMAILSSDSIPHPAVEALFTIDEETGMTGAIGLKGGLLDGKIMLNLDTEEDNEITIGCAGGIDVSARSSYKQKEIGQDYTSFKIAVRGLMGGHSGMEIHLGKGNANKLMNRLFSDCRNIDLRISSINGGGLRNAIPRESFAEIWVANKDVKSFKSKVAELEAILKKEYHSTDPDIEIYFEEKKIGTTVCSRKFQKKLVAAVYACPNGIYRMSPEVEGLVQTSNNLARIEMKDGKMEILCLTRSSVDSEKMDEAEAIRACFSLMEAEVDFGGSYPGWTPNPDAAIVKIMDELYTELHGEKADVSACHAGLECGILGTHYPWIEMISFGPTIRGAHSPDERASITSFHKFWAFLLETLKRIPAA